ncbi:cupin domain-containing protein [Paenibacillus eucommiae]|uniref:Mannose-6-phosphate isomerase-like protein (Cupin superfamily) n=1 Tax=Paenibacillus eucommiae TaxID=1355755 RepID=A0ABS4J6G2_9BACL|nr:cupin domain-containing protein [Paenibacillus eucommiae]MBP1995412.1 mannose-6-phosphate isomerase-like protein (cupin superfamily) [Paenibacillus eucommiae]
MAVTKEGRGPRKRMIHNPVIGDTVEFLQTKEETGGKYELVEVTLTPGGGNDLHYHLDYEEEFEAVEGILSIECDGEIYRLKPGDRAIARIKSVHRFYNDGKLPILFRVKVTPARNFEQMLRIAYGLAYDGRIKPNGLPRNVLELAVLFIKGGLYPPSPPLSVLRLIFGVLYGIARLSGVEKRLLQRYC